MNIIESYLNEKNILFHGSPVQGLNSIKPNDLTSRHDIQGKVTYASHNKAYASAFTFLWSDKDGIELGNYNKEPPYIKIPKHLKRKLINPCSLYVIKNSGFKQVEDIDFEWYSKQTAGVIKELKYKNPISCMLTAGLLISWK